MADQKVIKSLLLPMKTSSVIVPNTAIAEIVSVEHVLPVNDAPTWMLGYLSWRRRSVPLLSFDAVQQGEPDFLSSRSKIAVLYSISQDSTFPYMAILMQRAPKVISITEDNIKQAGADHNSGNIKLVLQNVVVNDEIVGDILDLKAVEATFKQAGY
ncbi:MAG: chemotaxis protein CheW [Gammaproteobacteria bacterium]|nr:chemotaxis protein CheW [Gammaproteobacteria bacterium]